MNVIGVASTYVSVNESLTKNWKTCYETGTDAR